MAKKNVSEIERGAGYFTGVVTNLMDIVREQEIPFEVIYRLATPAGRKTLKTMVETAHAAWEAEHVKPREQTGLSAEASALMVGSPYRGGPPSRDLPSDHYRIHVSYANPGVAALRPKFTGDVSHIFDGRPWKRHSSCAKIDETPGERIFLIKRIPDKFRWDRIQSVWTDLADYFDSLFGLRFAIETEILAFADGQPEHPSTQKLLALGSSTNDRMSCGKVPMLRSGLGIYRKYYRSMSDYWVGNDPDSYIELLLVRK